MKLVFIPLLLFLLALFISNSNGVVSKRLKSSTEEAVRTDTIKDSTVLQHLTTEKQRAKALRLRGELDSAITVLDHCLNSIPGTVRYFEEYKTLGWVYANRAFIYGDSLGDFLSAKQDYLEALRVFQKIALKDYYVTRFVYEPLGNIYTRHGENEQAIRLLREFKNTVESMEYLDYKALSDAHNDLGRAYMNKGDYENARRVLNEGIAKCAEQPNNLGLLYSSLAETEFLSGEIDAGIQAGKSSLINFEKVKRSINTEMDMRQIDGYMAGVNNTLGLLCIESDAFGKAEVYLQEAISISQRLYNFKHRKLAKIYCALGANKHATQAYSEAAEYYHKALLMATPDFDDNNVTSLPKSNAFIPEVTIGEALIGKAKAFSAIGKNESNKEKYATALKMYLAYFDWENKLRSEQHDFNSKLLFSSEIHRIGEEALDVVFGLKGIDENAGRIALNIIHQSNGIVLSENNARLLSSDKEIQKLTRKLRQYALQLNDFELDLKNAQQNDDSNEVARWQRKVAETDKLLQLTLFKIRKEYPDYDRLVAQNELPEQLLQQYLKQKNTNLISLFQGREYTYTVVINEEDYHVSRTPSNGVVQKSNAFLKQLKNPRLGEASQLQKTAHELYNVLFHENLPHLKKKQWVIIPDGVLHAIPMEALVTELIEKPSYKKLNYLLLERTIHYAPSLEKMLTQSSDEHLENYLGIAPDFSQEGGYPNLKFSQEEAGEGALQCNGEVMEQTTISKNKFLHRAAQFRVLHLSTHAGTDSSWLNNSWLTFADTKNRKNQLLGRELLQLQLNADLVVLNACETGSGAYYEGEGMLSFSRSFMDAGARNVLTNLWSVNHAANHEIITGFYKELNTNVSPATALRSAKLEYLKNENTDALQAHPHFWSPMILMGNNQQINIVSNTETSWLKWTGILLLLLLVLTVLYLRGRGIR